MLSNGRKRYPAAILTPKEVAALLRACSNRASTGMRNGALIVAMYEAGLRVWEALAMRPSDVDRRTGRITVAGRNGRGRRDVRLDPASLAILERWLERREALALGPESPVFCTLKGRPIEPAYFRALLPRLARTVGIGKRVHPRGLRNAHAAQLAARRVPVELLQAQLGHGWRLTTDRLLRRVAPHLNALRSALEIDEQPTGTPTPVPVPLHHVIPPAPTTIVAPAP